MFPAEWSFPISMHIPTITVICLNKTRQEITRRLLYSKCIASKYLTNERSSSYKSRPTAHLHWDKLRNWKVIAQLSYRALCLGDEFQLSGLWDTELVWAGSGTTLCGTHSSPPAWVAPSSSAASPSTLGKLSSPECSKSTWHCGQGKPPRQCKVCEMMLVGVKCCLKGRRWLGPWQKGGGFIGTTEHSPTDTFLFRVLRVSLVHSRSWYRLIQGGFSMENLGTNTSQNLFFNSSAFFFFSLLLFILPSPPIFLSKIIFPISYPESGRLFWWGWAELESKEKI